MQHGHSKPRTPTYISWQQMKARCLNPRHEKFPLYGGRGIEVCTEWLKFENFLADMGERPDGTTLDRLDNNRHYCKANCRWADQKTQQLNRRPYGLSRHKGVSFHKPSGKWQAQITIRGRQKFLGRFVKESDAAKAYNNATRKKAA